jgi:GT2 family glycosyltransferase
VSVVIVTWNGRQHLDICLAAVAAQQGVATETIIVDNGSTDGTAELIRSGYPWVNWSPSREPRLCRRNNAGAREARGRFVAFLNNDTSRIGWLRALLAGIDEPAASR